LAEVSLPDLRDEEQLLAASAEYSIAHLRSAIAALDTVVGEARSRVLELYGKEQRQRGEKERVAVWKPSEAFTGKRFTTEEEVDQLFDSEKERVKAMIRQGKTVQVI
jgi:tRNA A37 N6-isopentenylltransferase MiaA